MPDQPEPAGAPARPDGLGAPTRLVAVRRLLAAGEPSTGLDRLTALAATLLRAEHAQVSLLGEDQFVASIFTPAEAGTPDHADGRRHSPLEHSMCMVTASRPGPLVVVDARHDDRVKHLPPVTSGAVGAYLGVPLVERSGIVVGALCAYAAEPRAWTTEDVGTLGELAGSAVAELELAALTAEMAAGAARLNLALAAADIGCFDLDLATWELRWDDRLGALFGYDREGLSADLAAFQTRLHSDDGPGVLAAMQLAVDTDGELALEFRIRRPDGVRWLQARGRVVVELGRRRLVGVAYDSTEQRDTRTRLARVLESMSDALLTADEQWCLTYVNGQAEQLLGRPEGELLGLPLWDVLNPALSDSIRGRLQQAAESGRPEVFEERYGDGWLDIRVWPGAEGASVYLHDASARREAEAEREVARGERELALAESGRAHATADAANTRLALLADASTRLSASLEPQQVLDTLAEQVVPQLGRYLLVSVGGETAAPLLDQEAPADGERVVVVRVAHDRPEQERSLRELTSQLVLTKGDTWGPGWVVRTGQVEWLPEVDDGLLEKVDLGPEVLALLRELAPRRALTVPLVSRGRRLGAMTVGDPLGDAPDRALLADLASRAAVALDNALLYRTERRTGLTLQRSLLPGRVPELPGISVAVRYLPGATGAFVGGDWYQGVRVGGRLLLAMGDVMGHGMRSAARMGQLRAIVATLALEGHGPGALLERLAGNVEVLLDLELATLLVALYDPASRTLTVASAGHPPPLLAPLDAAPAFLPVEPGPPLGTFAGAYPEAEAEIPEGATLVLYTDGLVENRDESLEHGLERLRQALVEVRLPPEAVADHILDVLGRSKGGDDDVALLVLSHLP